jgi:hypothetical protein
MHYYYYYYQDATSNKVRSLEISVTSTTQHYQVLIDRCELLYSWEFPANIIASSRTVLSKTHVGFWQRLNAVSGPNYSGLCSINCRLQLWIAENALTLSHKSLLDAFITCHDMKQNSGNSVSKFSVLTRQFFMYWLLKRLDLIDFHENSFPSLKLYSALQSNDGYWSVQVIRLVSLIHVIGA